MRSTLTLAGLIPVAALSAVPAAAQQPIQLEDIVLSANRAPSEAARTGASVSVLTGEELRTGEAFVGDALARLPGFHLQQSGGPGQTSGFSLRGVPQGYVRVLVDGVEISDPSAPGAISASLSGLPTGGVDRLEVLKGSQSALYGGQAVAGVISLTTARPERDGIAHRVTAEAGAFDTVRGAYTLTGRGERFDLGLTLQGVTTEGFSAAEEDDGNPEADGYHTRRLSFAGSLYPTDGLRLFASGFRQSEDGEYDAFPPPDFTLADTGDTFEIDSWAARAGAELTSDLLTHTLSASWFDIQRDFYDETGLRTFGGVGDRLTIDYLGEALLRPDLDLQIGADHRRERARFDAIDAEADITGAFAQLSYAPTDALALTAALRRDEHSDFGGHTTGRVTAAYEIADGTVLRASAGAGFRPPSLDELFGPFGGNPDLEPETSVSYDLGVEQALAGGRASASVTLFRIEIEDLITYDPLCPAPVPPGVTCYEQVTAGESVSQGVELAADVALTDRIALSAGYTYTDAEQPLTTGGTARRARVPRHDAVLELDAAPTDRASLGLGLRYVADTIDAGEPLDDYTLVNLRAAYAVTEEAEVYVRVENLLDEQYQTVRGYSTSDRALYAGLAARF